LIKDAPHYLWSIFQFLVALGIWFLLLYHVHVSAPQTAEKLPDLIASVGLQDGQPRPLKATRMIRG